MEYQIRIYSACKSALVSEYRFNARLEGVCFTILKIQGIYPFYCE